MTVGKRRREDRDAAMRECVQLHFTVDVRSRSCSSRAVNRSKGIGRSFPNRGGNGTYLADFRGEAA